MTPTRRLERRLGIAVRRALPPALAEFVLFGLKQGWACLFGGLMLGGLILSDALWRADWPLARYDALLIYAVGLQAIFLWLRLETSAEARVILLFHLTGTAMEIFKVSAGSWSYPEPALFKLWGVPLFSGFMYAAVGSYIARVIRIFEMRFAPYPALGWTWALAVGIYVNFFAHHFLPDLRVGLMMGTVVLFGHTRVWFTVIRRRRWMPLPLAAGLASLFLWIAENVGTATGTWLYAGQERVDWVSLSKMGSWYLLLYVSFATVTLVSREMLVPAVRSDRATAGRPRPAPPRPAD